ncbi:potassium channel family protein [Rhodococcus sp. GXMU-t2271]|uniref:Potassium channel family protein n=1 Tax=Rhodococcus indonesiensis TaxID=3055869 RepID=A0ABT7RTZ4_9NOCA|nr:MULTISPECIES: potassium channel family protein [Rhodococcus]AUM19403.1 ion channel family protein [Rhodococcus ruber]MDM7491112.1 potassium channel family protein [Rhodococcus indonesiensis]
MTDGDVPSGLPDVGGRRLLWLAVLRPLLTTVLLVIAYFVLPLEDIDDVSTLTVLIGGTLLVCAVCAWQIRQVLRSPYPAVQAIEALLLSVAVYLVGYSTVYHVLSYNSPGSFDEPLSRIDALYFCMTVFATVGFGDIVATTETARVLVTAQMVGNLVLIALGLRFLTAAVKWRQQQKKT